MFRKILLWYQSSNIKKGDDTKNRVEVNQRNISKMGVRPPED